MTDIKMIVSEFDPEVDGDREIAQFDMGVPREVALDVFKIALHVIRTRTEDLPEPPEEMVFDVDKAKLDVGTNAEDPAEFVPLTNRPTVVPLGPPEFDWQTGEMRQSWRIQT